MLRVCSQGSEGSRLFSHVPVGLTLSQISRHRLRYALKRLPSGRWATIRRMDVPASSEDENDEDEYENEQSPRTPSTSQLHFEN